MSMTEWKELSQRLDRESMWKITCDKARLCIRQAQQELGDQASDQDVEDRASQLMDDVDLSGEV
jgi:uncharacterized membrane protein